MIQAARKKLNWVNISVLFATPLLAVLSFITYTYYQGFSLFDLIPFVLMYAFCGISITAGYHRLWAHRAYKCNPVIQAFFAFFGASQIENSVLAWVADHRIHHRYVDKEEDPYNINKGFFWAHMGWILFEDPPRKQTLDNVKDLKKFWILRFQHKYYVLLAAIAGIGVPFALGLAWGRPWGAVIWGGLIRLVVVHHSTFLINSAAHCFGKQPFSKRNSARDSFWLALLSHGEGYHNFHHAFPSDYRNGIAWHNWDPTKWIIRSLSYFGLSGELHRTSNELIAKARRMVMEEQKSSSLISSSSPALFS